MICLDPVGIVHSPYKETGDAPHQGRESDTVSVIEIYPRFIPGLGTMKGIHTIWVIYWMDRASRNLLSDIKPYIRELDCVQDKKD